ncbi:MAG: methyltransferase domain-containing protein [Pirellulales bacterium]|nr:methyltransferase domain-containing protein [Pirellulales bacterium]
MYEADYYTCDSDVGYQGDYFSDRRRESLFEQARAWLAILAETGIAVSGKVLEVGCATGEFCHTLLQECPTVDRVTGIDLSQAAIEEARSRYGDIAFEHGTIDNLEPRETYDAVFAFEVIEHLSSPDAFFRKASLLMREGAIFCLTTPNLECGRSIGLSNWAGFSKSLEHLYFFSPAMIQQYAARYGLKIERTLSGGGSGSNRLIKSVKRKRVKNALKSLGVLGLLRKTRDSLRPRQGLQHDYQSEEPRHTLFMVLRRHGPATPKCRAEAEPSDY